MVNERNKEHWEVMGRSWVANQRTFDRVLEPMQELLVDAVAVGPGEPTLDVGCGSGTTSSALVERGAAVHGIDISAPMITAARDRVAGATFAVADAQVDDLGGPYDSVVSRFGVMFFDDPAAAFANLRAHTSATGRLTFVCWNDFARSSAVWAGADVIRAALPDPPPPLDPHVPGPFGLSDAEWTRSHLASAGWTEVTMVPHELACTAGWPGDDGIEARMAVLADNEVGQLLRQQVPERDHAPILADVRASLRDRVVDGALQLHASVWLVTARA